jgi:pimeloyl-ACP methyl ester carboxylesterase
MSESTTILLVPGAWHSPECYNAIVEPLTSLDYNVEKVHLPSVGPSEHCLNFDADVAQIRAQITRAADLGQKVVVVVHSYGGLPANEAIKGLDIKSREQNDLLGGVTHLLFCCSFVVKEGDSLMSTLGGKDLPWWAVSDDKLEINPIDPEKIFYNDCDPGQVSSAVAALKPHSYQTLFSPCTYAAWRDVPSTYLYCTQDAAIPLAVQKQMVEETAKGTGMKTELVDASHSPFISQPEALARTIRRAAGENV